MDRERMAGIKEKKDMKRVEKDMNRERRTLIEGEKDRDRGREEQFIERQG